MRLGKVFLIIGFFLFFAMVVSAGVIIAYLQTRPLKYYVAVEDENLCNALNKRAAELGEEEIFVLHNKIPELQPKEFFEKPPVIAAVINIYERGNPTAPVSTDEKKSYHVDTRYLVPAIESDFSVSEKKVPKVTDPEISFSIYPIDEELPQKFRAIPYNGKYIGDEGYGLEVKKYVECSFLLADEEVKKKVEKILEDFFFESDKKIASMPKPIFVAGVGDMMLARGVDYLLLRKNGIKNVFKTTLPILQSNDILIGNLEGVLTNLSESQEKTYTFKFSKKVLQPLKDAGFTYLMQTNNHCYDYGEEGFKDTLAALKAADFPSSGIGKNLEEAKKFYHTEIDGQKFAIISCGAYPVEQSGFNGKSMASATEKRAGILWQSDELLESVKTESEEGNIVVVNVHGGEEYQFKPTKRQRKFYEDLIDNGASVVFGSHPHVIQPTEWYKNGLIVYSLGNFVFPGMEEMPGGTDSEIARLGFVNGRIVYVEQYPCELNEMTVELKK